MPRARRARRRPPARPPRRSACAGRAAARPSAMRPDHRRVAGAQRARPARRASPIAHRRAGQLEQRQRAAADLRGRGDDLAAAARRPAAARAASSAVGAGVEHGQHRELARARARGRGRGASVASSAASESLSMRTRARQRVAPARRDRRRACRPSGRACGPPSSLSRAEADDAPRRRAPSGAPAARRPAASTSSASTPEPTSSITGTPSPHSASISTSSVKPSGAEVRRVRAQDRAGALAERRARSRPAACGWWCRPRPAARPACATTSGMRKPPPISISCPRETTTSRPGPASAAAASSTAAAQLLTTSAASAPGELAQQRLDVRVARAALAAGRGRARGSSSPRPRAATAARAARGQRRAPEVRVHDTPVALSTRRSEGCSRSRARATRSTSSRCPRRGPPRAGRPARPAPPTSPADRPTAGRAVARARGAAEARAWPRMLRALGCRPRRACGAARRLHITEGKRVSGGRSARSCPPSRAPLCAKRASFATALETRQGVGRIDGHYVRQDRPPLQRPRGTCCEGRTNCDGIPRAGAAGACRPRLGIRDAPRRRPRPPVTFVPSMLRYAPRSTQSPRGRTQRRAAIRARCGPPNPSDPPHSGSPPLCALEPQRRLAGSSELTEPPAPCRGPRASARRASGRSGSGDPPRCAP